jgi:hypothetical protein
MVDREFTELDLLEDASDLRPDVEEGRRVVTARHRRRAWEIVDRMRPNGSPANARRWPCQCDGQ